jgi:hypothetical protein
MVTPCGLPGKVFIGITIITTNTHTILDGDGVTYGLTHIGVIMVGTTIMTIGIIILIYMVNVCGIINMVIISHIGIHTMGTETVCTKRTRTEHLL